MQGDAVAGFHAARDRLVADARVADFLFRIVGIDPEDVQGDLPVDGHRLNTSDDSRARALQHMAAGIIL